MTANHVGCNPFVRTASCSPGCPGAAVWGCAGVRDAYCTAFFEEGTCSASSIYDSHLESYRKPFIWMARPTWRTCRRRRYGVAYAMHRSGDWLSLEYVSRISCAAKTAKNMFGLFRMRSDQLQVFKNLYRCAGPLCSSGSLQGPMHRRQ